MFHHGAVYFDNHMKEIRCGEERLYGTLQMNENRGFINKRVKIDVLKSKNIKKPYCISGRLPEVNDSTVSHYRLLEKF